MQTLRKAGIVAAPLEERIIALLRERNWLVHEARSDFPAVASLPVHYDSIMVRIERISAEVAACTSELLTVLKSRGRALGLPKAELDTRLAEIRRERGLDQS